MARVHGRPARQRVPAALVRGAAADAHAERLHPRLLLHLAADRPARRAGAQPDAVRALQRRDAAALLVRLSAPGLRHAEHDRRPRVPLGRGAAEHPRRQCGEALRAPRREAARAAPGAVRRREDRRRAVAPADRRVPRRPHVLGNLEGTVANVRDAGLGSAGLARAQSLDLFWAGDGGGRDRRGGRAGARAESLVGRRRQRRRLRGLCARAAVLRLRRAEPVRRPGGGRSRSPA